MEDLLIGDIPNGAKKIGLAMSGGCDSSLLFYLLYKKIIDELESESRGPYAGAVGYFSFNGCCDFAIAIRSIFADNGGGFVQAGAGIVFDSIPDNELKETEHKANAMITALMEASK